MTIFLTSAFAFWLLVIVMLTVWYGILIACGIAASRTGCEAVFGKSEN